MKLSAIATALLVGSTSAFVSPRTTAIPSTSQLQATIAVFGASGLTSQECIYQALKDGDTVIGLTRNPSNVKVPKGSGGADADQPLVDPKLTLLVEMLPTLQMLPRYLRMILMVLLLLIKPDT